MLIIDYKYQAKGRRIPEDIYLDKLILLKKFIQDKWLSTAELREEMRKVPNYRSLFEAEWIVRKTYRNILAKTIHSTENRRSCQLSAICVIIWGLQRGLVKKTLINKITPDINNKARTSQNCIYKYQII